MATELFRLCHRMTTTNNDTAEVELFGEIIGDYGKWWKDEYPNDKSALDFKKDIMDAKASGAKKLKMRINSPGGVVSQAVAMRSILSDAAFDSVDITIDGLCASAATLIATLPGATVRISEGSQYMIHRPIAGAYGTAADMDSVAASLRNIENDAVAMYAEKTGQSEEQLHEWMDAETWFSAADAVKYGFADKLKRASAKAALPAVACVSSATMAAMRELYHAIPPTITVSPGESSTPTEDNNRRDNSKMDINELTVDMLVQQAPALVDEIRQSAIAAERERVADIESLTMPGYEELAEQAKANGTSAMDFHKQLAAAMRQKGKEFMESRKAETIAAAQVAGQSASDNTVDEAKILADNANEIAAYAKAFSRVDGGMY